MTAYGTGHQYPRQPPYPQQYPQYPQYPQQPPNQPQPRVNPAVLAGVSLWRLAIVACALYGFSDATGWTENFEALSQQSSLATAIIYSGLLLYPVFTAGRRHEPASPWLRGATTVMLLLVTGTFFGIIGGDFDYLPFEHVYTPLLVFVDWLFVGRNQAAVRWWHPLSWVAFPLAYFVYYLSAEVYKELYPFLDPEGDEFALVVPVLLVGVIVIGYLLYGTAKTKAAIRRPPQPAPYRQPNAYTPQGWTR